MNHTSSTPITRPEQINAAIAAAFGRGDLDAYIDLHIPEATVVAPTTGHPVHGLDAIRVTTAPFITRKPAMTSTVMNVVEGDGIALTHARWQLSATASDGEPIEMRGRGTIVSVRQVDGTWRIAIDDPLTPV